MSLPLLCMGRTRPSRSSASSKTTGEARQDRGLGLRIQCSFSAARLNAKRGGLGLQDLQPLFSVPSRHHSSYHPRISRALPLPRRWRNGHRLLCFQPGAPGGSPCLRVSASSMAGKEGSCSVGLAAPSPSCPHPVRGWS